MRVTTCDDFIKSVHDLLLEEGYGHVKYIDQLDGIVTRYTNKLNKIEEKVVRVENVADAHQREHRL